MLNVEPVYSRLKDVTDGEITSVSRKEPMVGETTGSVSEYGEGRRRRHLRIKTRTRASQIIRTRCLVRMLGEIDSTTTSGTDHEDRRC